MANQDKQVDEVIRTQIPNWNQLFGQNSQCECDECESMTGAPAYLAHILHFAEKCRPNENPGSPQSPYDILVKRAPYLPYLPLTCENTNIQLPYIQVVLEILEFYALQKSISDIPAYDSGSADWQEGYNATAKNAYKLLSTQNFPFSLPYHQPLDVIRTYLNKSNTSLTDLLKTFNAQNPTNNLQLIKEYVALSAEEYELLTQFKINGNALEVFALYGFDNVADFRSSIFGEHGVSTFMGQTGILYAELIDVFKTQYVNPGINALDFIQHLFLGASINGTELFSSLKDIKSTPATDPGLGAKIQNLLNRSNKATLNTIAFKKYIDQNFDSLQQTIVIIPDIDDPCNYSNARLGSVQSSYDSTIVNPIDDAAFKRLYFFIRLLKKTGLQIADLDSLLTAFSSSSNDSIIGCLAYYNQLKELYEITLPQFICLAANTNPTDLNSVYYELFLAGNWKNDDNAYKPDEFGNFTFTATPFKTVGKYNDILLTALGVSEVEMDMLTAFIGVTSPETLNLSMESISVFYSYVLLADLLQLQISTLIKIMTAFGKDDVLRKYDNATSTFRNTNLDSTLMFLEFMKKLRDSDFTNEEFLYVTGLNNNNQQFQLSKDNVNTMLIKLQQGLNEIEQQNQLVVDNIITENLITSKLLILFNKEVVAQLAGVLNGKITYAITAPGNPALNIPAGLASKISYDATNGRLSVIGPLTLSDFAIYSTDALLKNTLEPIWNKSFSFLKDNFSSFITDTEINKLLNRTAEELSVEEKLKAFYQLYNPHLVIQLGYSAVITKVASLLKLDNEITTIITNKAIENLYDKASEIVNEINLNAGYFPEDKISIFINDLITISKSGLFVSKFGLTADEITYLINHSTDFGNLDLSNISSDQWLAINKYFAIKKATKSSDLSWLEVFKLASSGAPLLVIANCISLLTGWSQDTVKSIIAQYGYAAEAFKNADITYAMLGMFKLANKTSLKVQTLASWGSTAPQFDALYDLGKRIKNEVLQQFIAASRSDNEQKISASVLENQRNALVAHILTLEEIRKYPIRNVEELCGYFLIDVPMTSCMPTTRVRQAISTVQTFIKRCTMGLESAMNNENKQVGVAPYQIDAKVWEPKSFFRTWQVTMEFLTNPYPYLSYKYLIERSEAAQDLESALLKSDVTQRTVEDAYRNYLRQMCDIANLEVAAMYIDDSIDIDGNAATKFIHVICKSRTAPVKYYYCTKNESDRWSFLQEIPITITENDGEGKSQSGSHLLFVRFRERYYLFMPEFVRRHDKDVQIEGTPQSLSTTAISSFSFPLFSEIKLAVSELYQGKWTKKNYLTLNGDWTAFNNPYLKQPSSTIFNIKINRDSTGNDISLDLNLFDNLNPICRFTFFSLNSAVIISKNTSAPGSYSGYYQNLTQSKLQLPIPEKDGMRMDILENNESDSKQMINYSPQFSNDLNSVYDQPFFFQDHGRSYYVTAQPFTYIEPPTVTQVPAYNFFNVSPIITVLKKPLESVYLPLHGINL